MLQPCTRESPQHTAGGRGSLSCQHPDQGTTSHAQSAAWQQVHSKPLPVSHAALYSWAMLSCTPMQQSASTRSRHTALLHLKRLPSATYHMRSPPLVPSAALCPASLPDGLHDTSCGQRPVLHRSADSASQSALLVQCQVYRLRSVCNQGHNMQAPLLASHCSLHASMPGSCSLR